MNSSHSLLQPIWVPRDVIVEQNVAALEIDTFSGCFGRDKYLSRSFPELLFSVESRSSLVTRTDVHTTVDRADSKIPLSQLLHEVVERVLELSEYQKHLLRIVEEAL